jgi:hypothetical protein
MIATMRSKSGRINASTVLIEPTSGNIWHRAGLRRRGEGTETGPHHARDDVLARGGSS